MASYIRGSDNFDTSVYSDKALSGEGYVKLPSGLIIQWGQTAIAASGTETFPIAFPTAAVSISFGQFSSTSSTYPLVLNNSAAALTSTGFNWYVISSGRNAYYIAVGY
jgi:hypothetical protein